MEGYVAWGNVVQTGIAMFAVGVLVIAISHILEGR
jgi:hypothetical protein